ncbi:MAG TPA: c-type cytochrome, partial [Blastocatellia bacterium]|nr:c-type cytochrome [Blastocatellia bacterium]
SPGGTPSKLNMGSFEPAIGSTLNEAGLPGSSAVDAAKLFADNCASCHAADGHGLMLNQPNFTDPKWQAKVSDEEMFKVIKYGREPMPFWMGSLNDEQIRALVAYIRTLIRRSSTNGDVPATRTAAIANDGNGSEKQGAVVPTSARQAPPTDSCYQCHQRQTSKIVSLYEKSAHFAAGKSCNACHAGDPTAVEKESAHSLNFIGKPTGDQAIRICGQCHRKESIEYKASHHFSNDKRIRRADCVECHGAHTVGNPAPDFSFNLFCSGCHGLEYLPGLQEDFQNMLKLSDDLRARMRELRDSGTTPSDEILKRRREIRDLTGEIVHKTDLKGGSESIPHILELGEQLKQMIDRQKTGKQV